MGEIISLTERARKMEILSLIERARKAQQENEQKHDVQLEIPGAVVAGDFMQRRQEQIELETGRDPRD